MEWLIGPAYGSVVRTAHGVVYCDDSRDSERCAAFIQPPRLNNETQVTQGITNVY